MFFACRNNGFVLVQQYGTVYVEAQHAMNCDAIRYIWYCSGIAIVSHV